MLSNPIEAYAKAYNFNILTDCAYGFVNSFLVSVFNDGYKKSAFVNFFTPESEEGDLKTKMALTEGINALQLKALEEVEVSINGIFFSTDVEIAEFDEAIISLCDYLLEFGMQPIPVCSECGYTVSENDSAYISVFNNRAMYICDECAEEAKVNINAVEPVLQRSKTLGIVGAVLGSVVSFAAVLLLYAFVIPYGGISFGNEVGDSIDALIFALPATAVLSVLTFLGYRIFTRRKGTERLLPCFIISTVFTLLSVYSASAIIYANSFGVNFSSAVNYNVMGIILGSPFTDPFYRADLLTYGLFSLAITIVVTLIYSIVFDNKKASSPVFIPVADCANDDGSEVSSFENDENEEADITENDN